MWRGGGGGYFDKFHESVSVQSITSLNWNWTLTAVNRSPPAWAPAVNYCKHRSHTHDFRWSTLWTSARFTARICRGEGKIYWGGGKERMRLVISKKLWWIWGRRFENNLSFLKMATPPSQQMNDQPSDGKNRPTKPVVFKICLKGSLWRCKKGHTFRKLLTAQLTIFAACEIKREIVKETNRDPRGIAA